RTDPVREYQESPQRSGNPDSRQWHRYPPGGEGEDVQSLLHNEAGRRRNRAWPFDLPRHHRETARWQNRCRYQTRRIFRIHHYAASWYGGTNADWRRTVTGYILVVDDEPDLEVLFRQEFRRDLRSGRFLMEFAPSAPAALLRAVDKREPSLFLILSD